MMTKMTGTVELSETTVGLDATRGGVRPTIPAPLVIATPDEIRAGSVLVKSGASLPDSNRFESKHFGPWVLLTKLDGFEFERMLSEEAWHFFFVVPDIAFGALSFSRHKAMRAALKKVFASVEAQGLNALEIVETSANRILGLHYSEDRGARETRQE